MVKSALVTLIIGLCSNAFAQGTMLFTWHGQNNYFQASFQCTLDETLPGSIFNSSLWTNSIQISSLDGLTYRASDTPTPFIAGHFGPPLSLTFIFADQNTLSRMEADVVPGQGAFMFEDSPLPNGQHGEFGSWSYEIIPRALVCYPFNFRIAYIYRKEIQSMNRLKLLLAILILPACSFAQGTMLFTWHGENNYFQASFQCTFADFRETIPAEQPTPSESLQTAESSDAVRRALADLSEDLRTPLILSEYEELSDAEIGTILNCSPKAIETRLYRARKQRRALLSSFLS